ncbi:MAG TPA: nucleotidyltransferase domain-containing protein [Fluviicoccus sp.]|nr:nucleotidyltransferase domain-containing protein [Fluviicoccus sp.]
MNATIQESLDRLARDHQVTILWAGEAGDRARGIPSSDSPYDVRFIYVHQPAHYLRVFDKRDVIELPGNGPAAFTGWDIKKALGMLRKSHPGLREWLSSTMVYRKHEAGIAPLMALLPDTLLPSVLCIHYLAQAKDCITKLAEDRDLRLIKYVSMFRDLLACQWVVSHGSQPPLSFSRLLNEYLPRGDIREQLDELLELKTQVREAEMIPPQPDLDEYLLRLYGHLQRGVPGQIPVMDTAVFDQALLRILRTVHPDLHL